MRYKTQKTHVLALLPRKIVYGAPIMHTQRNEKGYIVGKKKCQAGIRFVENI